LTYSIRKLTALLVVCAAVAVAFAAAPTASASTDAIDVKVVCGFADPAIWNQDTKKNAYDSEMVLVFPESVAPGETFDVTVDFDPQVNGPVAIRNPGDAIITAWWNVAGATENGDQESEAWENPDPIGVLEPYDIDPLVLTLTAGQSGSVDLEYKQLQLLAIGTITLVCGSFDAQGNGTEVHPEISIPISGSSSGTTTTSTTVAATTTTTVAEDVEPYVAQVVVKSASIDYMCIPEVNGESQPDEAYPAEASIAAVDKVNKGQSFSVGLKLAPGPTNGPTAIPASQMNPAASVVVGGGSDAGTVEMKGSPNDSTIAAGKAIPLAPMQSSLTATGEPGTVITFKAGDLVIDASDQATVVRCTPESSPVILSTQIVSQPVDLQNDGELPFTGLGDYLPQMIFAGLLLYLGAIFLSTLPTRRRSEG